MKLIKTLSTAIISVVESLIGITTSVDHLVSAANHATSAIDLYASDFESEAEFSIQQSTADREEQMKKWEEKRQLLFETPEV